MHVMTKYLDTRKAAISALQDFAVMEQIIDTTDEQIKTAYDNVTTPPHRNSTECPATRICMLGRCGWRPRWIGSTSTALDTPRRVST